MRYVPHSLGYLNTSLPVGGTVWRRLGGITMGHQEPLLKWKKPSLLFALCFLISVEDATSPLPVPTTIPTAFCHAVPALGNLTLWKQTLIPLNCLGPDRIFCLLALFCCLFGGFVWLLVFYHSNTKVTKAQKNSVTVILVTNSFWITTHLMKFTIK